MPVCVTVWCSAMSGGGVVTTYATQLVRQSLISDGDEFAPRDPGKQAV